MRVIGVLLMAVLGLLAAIDQVVAQTYPQKPIRMLVPWPPGAGTDLMARLVAQRLSEVTGQPVIVDNRSGAGGMIGSDAAAKASPDGYTIIMSNIAFAFSPALFPKMPYDTLNDFSPISLVATQPYLLVVHPSLPTKSIKELVALAKAKPGQIAYASAGAGSGIHLATVLFTLSTKTSMLHVPYKGGGPALTAVMGGEAQVLLSTLASAIPHVKSGRLRALGVSSRTRIAALPDVPPLSEVGVPGYETSTWYGLQAPAATPAPIVEKLSSDVVKILGMPEVKSFLDGQGMQPVGSSPKEFRAFIKVEVEKWSKVIVAAGVKGE